MVDIVGLDRIKAKTVEYVAKVEADISSALISHAAEVTTTMQGSAPWHDKTGEARAFLAASVQPVGSGNFTSESAGLSIPVSGVSQGFNFVLHGDSDHNRALEVENAGKFAVITPTFYQEQVRVVEVVRSAVNK